MVRKTSDFLMHLIIYIYLLCPCSSALTVIYVWRITIIKKCYFMTQVLLIQFLGEARFSRIAYFMREARVEQRLAAVDDSFRASR